MPGADLRGVEFLSWCVRMFPRHTGKSNSRGIWRLGVVLRLFARRRAPNDVTLLGQRGFTISAGISGDDRATEGDGVEVHELHDVGEPVEKTHGFSRESHVSNPVLLALTCAVAHSHTTLRELPA